jgi:DNA-binding response OmpR family regulator
LRSILSSDGYAVSVAGDIWAGFARVALQAYDLLLLDDDVRLDRHEAMMVVDLLSFARLKHPATRGIVLSSFEDDVPRYRREDGVLAVLEKPVEVGRLRSELEALSSRQAQQSGN